MNWHNYINISKMDSNKILRAKWTTDVRKLLWYTLGTSSPNLLGLDNDSCEIRTEIISLEGGSKFNCTECKQPLKIITEYWWYGHAITEISKYKCASLDKILNLESTTNNFLLLHMPFLEGGWSIQKVGGNWHNWLMIWMVSCEEKLKSIKIVHCHSLVQS
jgi:hypothetical protein